jgi:hypothetical protein
MKSTMQTGEGARLVLTLWSHDRDFLKFDFLSIYDPFE